MRDHWGPPSSRMANRAQRRRVAAMLLLATTATAKRSKVEMHGQCAAVARSNVWTHEVRDVDPLTGDDVGPILESQVRALSYAHSCARAVLSRLPSSPHRRRCGTTVSRSILGKSSERSSWRSREQTLSWSTSGQREWLWSHRAVAHISVHAPTYPHSQASVPLTRAATS